MSVSRWNSIVPFGWKNGKPGASSWKLNRSSCSPSTRWSRLFASSIRRRCSFSSFLSKNAVPYTRTSCSRDASARQYEPATLVSFTFSSQPVFGTCGPRHRSTKSPWR